MPRHRRNHAISVTWYFSKKFGAVRLVEHTISGWIDVAPNIWHQCKFYTQGKALLGDISDYTTTPNDTTAKSKDRDQAIMACSLINPHIHRQFPWISGWHAERISMTLYDGVDSRHNIIRPLSW